tara:strand:- start:979 stop:1641 length:663 start_codon:yes stop_codon:yes gene_type:complete
MLLLSCSEQETKQPVPKIAEPSAISLFAIQDSTVGYGGSVGITEDTVTFTSNTNPECVNTSHCRRVELSKKITLPVTFSYSFEVVKWDVDEYKCGTHKGKPKGCYVIISQFWNDKAAPRAYVVLQKIAVNTWRLSFHNKNDEGKLDYVWHTNIGEGIHNIEVFNDGYGAMLSVNSEASGYREMDVTYTTQDYLKWGMYWQKEMEGSVVIRFSDVVLEENL